MIPNIRFISAGAGTGKTYRLTQELEKALVERHVNPRGVIGMTFTNKAAGELRERVRERLIQSGHTAFANQMGQALLGTVNSVCGILLSRFAFEIGLSPKLQVIPEEDAQMMFNRALDDALSAEDVRQMNEISIRLGLTDNWSKKDWRNDLRDIVTAARANDMSSEDLAEWGKHSAKDLLSLFPKPSGQDLWGELKRALDRTIAGILASDDETKSTQNYIKMLQGLMREVGEKRLSWSNWVKLSKEKPTKKSMGISEPVRTAAFFYDRHPQLHEDIRDFCELIFKLAAGSMKTYGKMKKKLGMIDFVDQEQLMLHALNLPEVFQILSEELELLLVDEFQDTSPIQLALFLRLAEAAREAVFVGDIKQAIYGFRGSDPELMLTVQHEIENQGEKATILETSRRSRPSLIAYTNALFVPAFSNSILADHVRLKAYREEKINEPAVSRWILCGQNAGVQRESLALGITRLIKSEYQIVDINTDVPRKVHYGDIAVLAKTNDHVSELADTFAKAGIPTQMDRPGLLKTSEARLAMACLRRMADPVATLASAEIVTLCDCSEPEIWLENRLRYLEVQKQEHLWGEVEGFEHPALCAIAGIRENIRHLSPSEALISVINAAEVRRTVSGWGPNEWRVRQRLQNIDALIAFAKDYEEHCITHQKAATIAGLMIWFQELQQAKLDTQPGDPMSDAVQVMTHHRAKGLEWPVVIATDLNDDLKPRVWGLNVISEKRRVDLKNPLSGRFLRLWPYPFANQRKDIPVVERLEKSDFGRLCDQREREESTRLLYVSMTRARDVLVIPLPEKKPTGEWMKLLNADWMLPSGDVLQLPDGYQIPAACWKLGASEKPASMESEEFQPFWFAQRKVVSEKPPAILNPSGFEPWPGARIEGRMATGNPLKIVDANMAENLGTLLHHLIAAEAVSPSQTDALDATQKLIDAWELTHSLDAAETLAYIREFFKNINSSFKPIRILAEYPVIYVLKNGQAVKGLVDLLVKTKGGWVIIDHKFTDKSKDELPAEALKYSGQLKAYKDSVEAATSQPVIGCWVHFPTFGEMLQIEFY